MSDTALIPLETINPVEVFTGQELEALLEQITATARSQVAGLGVAAASDRKEIKSIAYKVARSKTTIDDAGKSLVEGWKKQAAVVDASRKKARDTLDALKAEISAPVDAWEAEQARVAREAQEAEERKIAAIEAARVADIERRERELAAQKAAFEAQLRVVREKDDAERRAKEQAEREAVIRVEAAAAAEAKAKADAAATEERHRRELIEAAERERQAGEARERQRLAAEQAKRAEDERRASNMRRRGQIKAAAAKAIVAIIRESGDDPDLATTRIVEAIEQDKIPHLRIDFA